MSQKEQLSTSKATAKIHLPNKDLVGLKRSEEQKEVTKEKTKLPKPTGWRMLVLPFRMDEKTKGGILIAQESLDKLRVGTNCGYVLKMGPLAYHDREKFPTGPWCKQGQWVIFARYAGSRLPIEGGEVRLLNDDEVLGKIDNPESVLHRCSGKIRRCYCVVVPGLSACTTAGIRYADRYP